MSVNKEIIERIRTSFLSEYQGNVDMFHPADIEKIKSNDWPIERFVLVTKTEVAALKKLIKAMVWRKTFGVNDFDVLYFPQELYKTGLFNTLLKDKEGRPTLWYKFNALHKSDLTPIVKKYFVYNIEKMDRMTSHQGWTMIFDSTGSGLSNVDVDFMNFVIEVFQHYYPRGLKYQAVIDLPWVLNATAKVVMALMNDELRNATKFIKKDELSQYIDQEYIPVHLGGSNDKSMIVIPEGVKPIEELAHLQLSADQIKNFYSAFKAELN